MSVSDGVDTLYGESYKCYSFVVFGVSDQVNATNVNENVIKAYGVSSAKLHF